MLSRRLLRIKVIKALYSHFKSESDSMTASLRSLRMAVDKTYELYHLMLWLVVEVARYGEQRIELARNKRLPTREDLNPNRRFVDNAVIAQIKGAKALTDYLAKRKLTWKSNPELIKNLFNELTSSDFYKAYMAAPELTFRDEAKLIEDFYVNIVAESAAVEETVEEQSVFWADDTDFALLMVVRTVTSCRPAGREATLLPQFKNEEDSDFAGELFRAALTGYNDYMKYVERYTQNWDVDRIAFVDGLLMVSAIAELLTCATIPVKVTLDEYIEISKYYSTSGSSNFVNGILDKVVEELRTNGQIVKTGRGLL